MKMDTRGELLVVLVPAISMAIGEAISQNQIPRRVQAASQNLSAGIILGALAFEIQPLMSDLLESMPFIKGMLALTGGSSVSVAMSFLLASFERWSEGDGATTFLQSVTLPRHRASSINRMGERASLKAAAATQVDEALHGRVVGVVDGMIRDAASLQDQVDRVQFDETIHKLDFQLDNMYRIVSRTPDWTEAERKLMVGRAGSVLHGLQGLKACLDTHLPGAGAPKPQTDFEEMDVAWRDSVGKPMVKEIVRVQTCIDRLHKQIHRTTFRRWGPLLPYNPRGAAERNEKEQEDSESDSETAEMARKPRLVLVFTVTVDSFVDGFLIGLCIVSSAPTAVVMAGATTIEMGFLGLAYSAALRARSSTPSLSQWVALYLPPLVLVSAGFIGATVGSMLEESQCAYLGMLSFSATSLLFLVTQELLVEAHESTELPEDINTVTIWLFVGMLLAIAFSNVA